MKKIAIITPFLARGGLERVAILEAQELQKEYDVTLIVLDSFIMDYPYEGKIIDVGVSLVGRGVLNRIVNVFLTIIRLRKIKKDNKFDIVISHGELANIPNVFSGGKNNIVTMHENRFVALKDMQGRFVNKIIKRIYSLSNILKIVAVSKGTRHSYIKHLEIDENRITTIYNPFNIGEIKKLANEPLAEFKSLFDYPVLISAGRLTNAKGQWHLIRVFKELKKTVPDLKLVILGDGELRENLLTLSSELELKTFSIWSENQYDDSYDVYFLGFQNNPFKFIKHSKLLLMTSIWEGFGNTIVEAMACGVPVISSNCESGPGEIISTDLDVRTSISKPVYGEYGMLLPAIKGSFLEAKIDIDQKEKEWIDAIYSLLKDDEKLIYYSKHGMQRAEDFRLDVIISQWNELINSLIH